VPACAFGCSSGAEAAASLDPAGDEAVTRLLITGVSGFIGQALVAGLDGQYEIHGLYERPESTAKNPQLPGERQYVADLRDQAAVEDVVRRVQPDLVIHLAARSEVANSFANYREVSEINYVGTVTLAEACRKLAPGMRLFVMASTMETYGHHDRADGPFTEDTAQHPMAPYAVAKLACEKYLGYMQYAYGFPSCVLRQTNSYGRHDNDFFVMERIITQMLAGDVCNLGDWRPWRNFLHIDDLVELYRAVLEHPAAVGETFVTGPDNALPIGGLAALIAERLDWDGQTKWHTIEPRPGEIFYLNSDPAKAARVLGWAPKVSLVDGIDRTIELWRR
jgi:GDP-6-deoxy-D-talose 4-dehydrogenase